MNYSDKLALIREYKNQGGKGSYLSLLSEVKKLPDGGTIQDSNLPPKAYNPWQGALSTPSNVSTVSNTFIRPNHIVQDNIYQPPLPGYANVKYDLDNPPEFAGTFKPVEIKPTNVPYRNDVASRREDLKKIPITTTNSKEYPKATQVEFMKQQVADRPDYERLNDFTNFAATGFGLAPMGVLDNVVEGAIGLGGKYLPKFLSKADETVGNITRKRFKSEIDWAKWNKEIPENKTLLQEYRTIEQNTKNNGTWMKNSDGSMFQGTPEQFVQQNSNNFKKAFPNYYNRILNHNSPNKFDEFSDKFFGKTSDDGWYGKGVYTHPNKSYTKDYGDINYELYTNSKNKGFINEANIQGAKYYNKSYKEELKNIDNQISSYIKEIKDNPADYTDQEFFIEKINNMGKLKKSTLRANFKNKLENNIDRYSTLENPQNGEVVIPFNNPVKSAVGNNGMFDMTNPNIYKSLIPALGAGYVGSKFINNKNND